MSLLHMKIIKKENKRKTRLMLNIEKYRNVVLENLNLCRLETSLRELYGETVVCCPHTKCDECKKRFREWLLSEYKEPVLDDVEREYLSAVIKPFRNKVKKIAKISRIGQPEEQYIRIVLGELDFMNFPNFNTNTGMYKGMEADRLYSLEELGL